MITRIWHGWTTHANADAYEQLLYDHVFPSIEAKNVAGFRSIQLLRRELDEHEVEFATVMAFDSLEAVKEFAGEDYETAYVPDAARQVLARFDARAQHYEVRESRSYGS